MISDSDIIATFSPDSQTFAFRSNGLQRKYVDLYPLSEASDYKVTSSLVNHIDYESGDLKLEDLKFTTWCLSSVEKNELFSGKTKRRYSESEVDGKLTEAYFVNAFSGGKIVVFSTSGSEIANIIQNKREILGMEASGASIWIVDDEKVVKQFDYKSSKPSKTFHLVDGKSDEITNFQVLEWQDKVLLAVFTPTNLYIVDPSKRRPSTVVNMDLPNGRCCVLGSDSQLVVAGMEGIHIVELQSGKSVSKWPFQATKLKYLNGRVYALSVEGFVSVFQVGEQKEICSIQCQHSEILQFTFVKSSIIIAWLNVNEPKFEHITTEQIGHNKEIIFRQEEEVVSASTIDTGVEPTALLKKDLLKVGQSGDVHEDIVSVFLQQLDGKDNESTLLQTLSSDLWTDRQIKEMVNGRLSDDHINKIFAVISNEIARNAWATLPSCALWFKWLLTLRHGTVINASDSRSSKKAKQIRASLRASSDVYSLLLSMKGKLEMLSEQAKLREEFASMSLDSKALDGGINGIEGDQQAVEPIYVNGEGDEYVDALDYAGSATKVSSDK
ncbi:LADA_0A07976g1_1 [Lachancea dasiensis]|uniref:LADA_0A07976g1_1 n=1 Tax=Lachancea dasiensis TaxID=1072105 RepID=A0A1G4IQH4_9SACH|nr:LADA_0A07976g1_1 [Lachancea dasiensis]